MKIIATDLPGVVQIEPKVFHDPRGFFAETWNGARYQEAGLPGTMVQDNLSWSMRGVLRGLHFQFPHPQGKLVYVLQGEVLDVAVDIRLGSPNFGRSVAVALSAANRRQLYIPEGFAHGFCVVSEEALLAYKCTAPYRPDCDAGIAWNDPRIGVPWPVSSPVLSAKDQALPRLSEIAADRFPRYEPERELPAATKAA